ncbi:MAG: bacterioferritin-associated ferredoxin [Oligoflexales bacterium]
MYVCLCENVREKQVKEILDKNGESIKLKDVQKICAAGTNCGGCIPHLKQVFERLKTCKS